MTPLCLQAAEGLALVTARVYLRTTEDFADRHSRQLAGLFGEVSG